MTRTANKNIFVISHSCVVSHYRDRMVKIAEHPDIALTVLTPRKWYMQNRWVTFKARDQDTNYTIINSQPLRLGHHRSRLRNVAAFYPHIGSLMRAVKPDIVEMWEEPFSLATFHTIRRLKRLLPSARTIFFSAQSVYREYPFPFSYFEQYVYKAADFAYLMNRDVLEVMRKKGYRGPYRILPLGVNPETFCVKDTSLLKEQLHGSGLTVGFLGNLTVQKGVLDLVEAAREIGKSVRVFIIGSGDLKAEIMARAAHYRMHNRITVLDAVSYDLVPDYLNCMDLLVVPSRTMPGVKEQFGRVIVEAMACGVPVIGSDSGEIPRVIGDAGLIFKEGDYGELAEKIKMLRDDAEVRRDFAEKGTKRVLENFTWEKIAEEQCRIYCDLLR